MAPLRSSAIAMLISLTALPAMAGATIFNLPHLTYPVTETATQGNNTPATLPITPIAK